MNDVLIKAHATKQRFMFMLVILYFVITNWLFNQYVANGF